MRFSVFSVAVLGGLALSGALAALGSLTSPDSLAWADVQHVVARGHTVEAIAHRYHVTAQSIIDANHLKDPRHLKIGDSLTIPGVAPAAAKGDPRDKNAKKGDLDKAGKPVKPVTYAMRPKTPDVVHVTRLASNEEYALHVNARRGKVSPTAAKQAEQMMRSMGGLTHPIDTRLLHLLAAISNHFGSRKVEIISGFRPFSSLQHTAHSNHNIGKAIDFRVVGVPNEAVRDYCRTLREVGCGFYPNSTFVHLDAREKSSFWIDFSRPGEPPRYNAPNLDADEGTSDVGEEAHLAPPNEADEDDAPEPAKPAASPAPGAVTPGIAPGSAPTVPASPTPAPMQAPAPPSTAPVPGPSPAVSAPRPATTAGGLSP